MFRMLCGTDKRWQQQTYQLLLLLLLLVLFTFYFAHRCIAHRTTLNRRAFQNMIPVRKCRVLHDVDFRIGNKHLFPLSRFRQARNGTTVLSSLLALSLILLLLMFALSSASFTQYIPSFSASSETE